MCGESSRVEIAATRAGAPFWTAHCTGCGHHWVFQDEASL